MKAESGRGFLVKIGDGGSPEIFTTIAGMRTTALSINNNMIDVTNKDSGGWRELLSGSGTRRMSVTGAGVFTNSVAESTLCGKVLDGTLAHYEIVFENGDLFTGAFQVTALDYSGDHDGERSYTLALESSGSIDFVAGI